MGRSNIFFLNSEISGTFCTIFHCYTGTCCLQCKISVYYLFSIVLQHDKGISKENSGTFVILVSLNLRFFHISKILRDCTQCAAKTTWDRVDVDTFI